MAYFLLRPSEPLDVRWESVNPIVGVYAESEGEARKLASEALRWKDAWLDPDLSICHEAVMFGDPAPEGYKGVHFESAKAAVKYRRPFDRP